MSAGSLREQLARFHGAITGAASLESVRDLVERGEIDELARLRVYEHAYTARIASVLVHDYPKLAHLVGEAELRAWTADYLRAHPPSNFSLREVGAHLAPWLATHDAESHDKASHDEASQDASRELPAVLVDLARLERARTEVFDGPDATPLSREDLATMDPAEFPALRLHLVPSSRVIAIDTNADDVWDAIESAAMVPPASRAARTVLVWRRDLTVIHRTLEVDEAPIVSAMIDGTTFGAACELLDEATAAERAIELLVRWLDAGILRRG